MTEKELADIKRMSECARRMVSAELLPEGADPEIEAEKHPRMVEGFTHWSSPGWDGERQVPVSVLTFDPSCPACKEFEKVAS